MATGRYTNSYSCLSYKYGVLDAAKGLPLPKSQKNQVAQEMRAALLRAHDAAEDFLARYLPSTGPKL